jgi:hypothetical protein
LKFYPHHLLFSSLARRHGGFLASVHMQQGPYTDAIYDLEQGSSSKVTTFVLTGCGIPIPVRPAKRCSRAARMPNEDSRSHISPYHIGMVCLGLGDLDHVFSWFEMAYDDRDPDHMMIKVEPLLDGLRTDPRYRALLRKCVWGADVTVRSL